MKFHRKAGDRSHRYFRSWQRKLRLILSTMEVSLGILSRVQPGQANIFFKDCFASSVVCGISGRKLWKQRDQLGDYFDVQSIRFWWGAMWLERHEQ